MAAIDRVILHCDCNAFYASVECVRDPRLREVPMAVCGDPESRHGIILAKNERAKACGVTTAETIWQARQKCPGLLLVPPHHAQYAAYSREVNAIYARYTDQVEPFGIDESWLDVTGSQGLFGDGQRIADELRRTIRRELGLTVSVGVSFNKVFAKLGSDYKKPDATTVFSRENYRERAYPLPVSSLLYVGPSAAKALQSLMIRTIGELAEADRACLVHRLGILGETLHDYANGCDGSPVQRIGEERAVKSVGNAITFRRDLTKTEDVRTGVVVLSDMVAARLRKQGLYGRTVQITLKTPAMRITTRQRTLPSGTCLAKEIAEDAMSLLQSCWTPPSPIRMLTVTVQQLSNSPGGEQLSLFERDGTKQREKQRRLENTMDAIRRRYGGGAIRPASVLENDMGIPEAGVQKE